MQTSLQRSPAICAPYINEPPAHIKRQHVRRRMKKAMHKVLKAWLGSDFVSIS